MKPNPAKKNRTRQATAAVLALALGAAVVYLNWSFARAGAPGSDCGAGNRSCRRGPQQEVIRRHGPADR